VSCRVETKMFVFILSRNFCPLFAQKSFQKVAKIFVFEKVFVKIFVFAKGFAKIVAFTKLFAKIFHSQCGSGSRSHLNVYPDLNTGGCYLKFSRKPSRKQKIFGGKLRENEFFAKRKKGGFHFNPSVLVCCQIPSVPS
jgi:hypothetical protein